MKTSDRSENPYRSPSEKGDGEPENKMGFNIAIRVFLVTFLVGIVLFFLFCGIAMVYGVVEYLSSP